MSHGVMIERIRGEFLEMPGLRLTFAQVQRLSGLEPTLCRAMLGALVDAKFLQVRLDGAYARVTDGAARRPHPVKAEVAVRKRLTRAS